MFACWSTRIDLPSLQDALPRIRALVVRRILAVVPERILAVVPDEVDAEAHGVLITARLAS